MPDRFRDRRPTRLQLRDFSHQTVSAEINRLLIFFAEQALQEIFSKILSLTSGLISAAELRLGIWTSLAFQGLVTEGTSND